MAREGFFKESTLISKPPKLRTARCESCKLYLDCKSPKMSPTGQGKKKILLVGESPGKTDDNKNKHFAGQEGQILSECLFEVGIDMRKDCWITNAIICHPQSNRKPREKEISFCQPNLMKTIKELNPEIIITLGESSAVSLLSDLWKEKIKPLSKWIGWTIPCQELNTWIVPNWHPSYILWNEKSQQGKIIRKLFIHNLEKAKDLVGKGRPWETVPDYKSQIDLFFDDHKVPRIIKKMIQKGGSVSFDIETNMLKPDSNLSNIVCASVCWEGKKTIAFPWTGRNIDAMKSLLTSPLAKYGQNIKFEDRWIHKHLKIRVKNWKWDSMLGMHWADNRRGITGLKFQSFVHLGYGSYDDHISKFLKAKSSNSPNDIKFIDMGQLLLYCGLDSLLEHHIGELLQVQNNYY